MVNKALWIVKILSLEYFFLFLFNNIISYFIYTNNIFYIEEINKKVIKNKYGCITDDLKKIKLILNN